MKDGHDAVVVPFTSPKKIRVLSPDKNSRRWVASSPDSEGVHVPLITHRAVHPGVGIPYLLGVMVEDVQRLAPDTIEELHVVYDPKDTLSEQHLGIFVVLA